MKSSSRIAIKVIFAVCIILITLGVIFVAVMFKPEAEKKELTQVLPAVEVLTAKREDIPVVLPSQGLVEAKRVTQLASEVSGKVTEVSPKFHAGGEFKEGEMLVQLDKADYEAAAAQATAALADAKLELDLEEARAEKAALDWKTLGSNKDPNPLTLREPQLISARAKVESAKSALERAERDLERTTVRAPYPCRIREIQAELGTYLSPGARVASLFSLGPYEVRLPVSLEDYSFLKTDPEGAPNAGSDLLANIGPGSFRWHGEIVRTEGEVERESRSIYLVAEVDAPQTPDGRLFQPGLFVQAEVEGVTLAGVFQVPFRAFHDLDTIVVVDPDNRLHFRDVKVARRAGEDALVTEGLKEGERIMITELADVIEGMKVRVANEDADAEDKAPALTDSSTDRPNPAPKP